jgi:hypothetical protein
MLDLRSPGGPNLGLALPLAWRAKRLTAVRLLSCPVVSGYPGSVACHGVCHESPRRYVLSRSYVLLGLATIGHITEQIRAHFLSSEPQRIDPDAYESPALPLSYSAAVSKSNEREG